MELEKQLYVIVAEDRDTKKRVKIAGPMPEEQANNWQCTYLQKKHYKYFRKAKYNEKKHK